MESKILIGFTFYGGLSLAVYETGLACSFLRYLAERKQRMSHPGIKSIKMQSKISTNQHFEHKGISKSNDIEVISVSGASAGSISGYFFCLGLNLPPELIPRYIDKVHDIWIQNGDIKKLAKNINQSKSYFLDSQIIKDTIWELLKWCNEELSKCKNRTPIQENLNDCRFHISITHYNPSPTGFHWIPGEHSHNKIISFSMANILYDEKHIQKTIIDAICISSAFPCVFPVYKNSSVMDDKTNYYGDGGITDNKPIYPVFNDLNKYTNKNITRRILALVNPKKRQKKDVDLQIDDNLSFQIDDDLNIFNVLFKLLIPSITHRNITNEINYINLLCSIPNYIERFETDLIEAYKKKCNKIFSSAAIALEDLSFENNNEKDIKTINSLLNDVYDLSADPNRIYTAKAESEQSFFEIRDYLLNIVQNYWIAFHNNLEIFALNMLPSIKQTMAHSVMANDIDLCPLTPISTISGDKMFGFACFFSDSLRSHDFHKGYEDGIKYIGTDVYGYEDLHFREHWDVFPKLDSLIQLHETNSLLDMKKCISFEVKESIKHIIKKLRKRKIYGIGIKVRLLTVAAILFPNLFIRLAGKAITNNVEQVIGSQR